MLKLLSPPKYITHLRSHTLHHNQVDRRLFHHSKSDHRTIIDDRRSKFNYLRAIPRAIIKSSHIWAVTYG